MNLIPSGKDCGACGVSTCKQFLKMIKQGEKELQDCTFLTMEREKSENFDYNSMVDSLGYRYEVILYPIPGEPTTRKTVLPFRPDLPEKLGLKIGDIVMGRPTGQGCPVQHVLKIERVDYTTGLVGGHIVGPKYSRGNKKVIDIGSFTVIAFEGLAKYVDRRRRNPIVLGKRMTFLPRFCMLQLTHTGIVNMVIEKSYGTHVRFEHPIILHPPSVQR